MFVSLLWLRSVESIPVKNAQTLSQNRKTMIQTVGDKVTDLLNDPTLLYFILLLSIVKQKNPIPEKILNTVKCTIYIKSLFLLFSCLMIGLIILP